MPRLRFFVMRFLSVAIAPFVVAASMPANAAPPAPDGEAIFRQRCAVCHSVAADKPSGVGPNLHGISGRKTAAVKFNYSAAMKKSKIVWTKKNLNSYLASPTKLVPGTRMVIAVTNAADRAALVAYLMQLKK